MEDAAVDAYLEQVLAVEDEILTRVRTESAAAGLPDIAVSALQGRLLQLLVTATGAREVLEVGTLGGYSTICLARGGAHVTTLELDAHHAEVATANVARAGLAERVDVRVGPAADTLDALVAAGAGPYDLVFVDADKPSNSRYVTAALAMSRPGTMLIVDNVVRAGRITNAGSDDPGVVGSRAVLALLGGDPRLEVTALQTVGAKGWDGFAVARVR